MKKSKVIIPSLGLLLLSTAASVTGTVAWFTSTRMVQISTDTFEIKKSDGNLDISLTAGVGTTVSGTTVSIRSGAALMDYSYNPTTLRTWKQSTVGNYYLVGDATEHQKTEASDPASAWKINATSYAAVSWKATLSYTFGADETPVDLFLDTQVLAAALTAGTANPEGHQTFKGFRMAFILDNNTSATAVWAPNRVSSEAANVKCVTGETTTSTLSDLSVNVLYQNNDGTADATAMQPATDKTTGHTTREDYLAQFTTSVTSHDVYCVVWYEGTDPEVTDEDIEARLDKVAATIGFYVAYNG